MRILALDYGTKRVGVAISDELGMIATPVGYLDAQPRERLLKRITEMVVERGVGLVLVGMPRNMDGSYGPVAEQVREFVKALEERLSVPVKTWDERLTTAQAERLLLEADVSRAKRKKKVDQIAAAILLQSYLDHQGGGLSALG